VPQSQNTKLRRSREPLGYWLGDDFRRGYADDPDLPDGARRRIAQWAKAYTPEHLTPAQSELASSARKTERSAARTEAEALGSYQSSPFWRVLTVDEQRLVEDPSEHPRLRGATYPLSIGQLTALTDTSPDQVRYWHDTGLLRAGRTAGGHRLFYPDAAMRAFAFKRALAPHITVLREIVDLRQPAETLFLGIASVLSERASDFPDDQRHVFLSAAQSLQAVSDVLDQDAGRTRHHQVDTPTKTKARWRKPVVQ